MTGFVKYDRITRPMSSLDPIVLFFALGLAAGLLRSDLRLAPGIYDFLSVLLLLAIGLKGGIELSGRPLLTLAPQLLIVGLLGLALPLLAYPVLRKAGGLERADAASIAAHYGSVSVGTYAVAIAYLASMQVPYESHMPVFLVLLEMPAIVVGVVLARGLRSDTDWSRLAHEVFMGKSIVLLTGGLLIGWAVGSEGVKPLAPLFFDPFKGVLALFLLEMGLIAAAHVGALKRCGLFLLCFGVVMPVFSAALGCWLGWAIGLSVGGTTLLATLAASASYIAVPAAMRMAVPEANPALSLAAAIGVTFPFNVFVGIPLYLKAAALLHGEMR